jgi:tRNA pseudouridine55 synthase
VSGVLLLDKPVGISSNYALQAAKRLYRAAKAGHAGTLDPLASGLLPILFGDATRFSGYLLDADKGYEAEIRLGVTTATADAEGEVLERKPVSVTRSDVGNALARFRGAQTQVPPMYSALKREGTPLYVLARRGETVERLPRDIRISALEILSFGGESLVLRVACSKGTYIRTLAEDIGAALGCGAHLAGLRRIATGSFSIDQAVTLEALRALDEAQADALLHPADALIRHLPEVRLQASEEARFGHGQALSLPDVPAGACRVYGATGSFLGLAEGKKEGRLVPKRLLAEPKPDSPSG